MSKAADEFGASVRPSSAPDTAKTIPVRERTAAARVAALLSSAPAKEHRAVAVVDAEGEWVEVPAALTAIIHRAAELIAEGHPVAVMSDDEILSTQDAADLLNVSRQYPPEIAAGRRPVVQGEARRQAHVGTGSPHNAQRRRRRVRD